MNEPQKTVRKDTLHARITREHQHLHGLTVRIEETTDLASLPGMLHEFRAALAAHHQLEEEEGGLFHSICADAPHFTQQVARLRDEHATFLVELDELLPASRDENARESVHRAVIELIERMRKHDAEENTLLLDSVETDLGGRG